MSPYCACVIQEAIEMEWLGEPQNLGLPTASRLG
jgi:hypothetical protein